MSYTKLLKKQKRESMNKDKQERIARKQKKENELKFSDQLFIALRREERIQTELYEKKKIEIKEIKDNILLELNKNNPFTYPQFLIIWDILTGDYSQIESDRNRGKINNSDITIVFQYIKNFSTEIIDGYWNEKLLDITI
jgi:hypothetical protein